jgi:hypothetical protein
MNKFLDDSNIIKKEETVDEVVEDVDNNFDMGFEEEVVEEKPVKKKRVTPSKKKEEKKTIETKEVIRQTKTQRDIIIDLIDKFNEQKLTKEIELEVSHFMYNEGGSNKDREIYQRMIDNLAKEIRSITKKIEFLNKKL